MKFFKNLNSIILSIVLLTKTGNSQGITLTQDQSDLQEVLDYLGNSQGSLKMASRTATMGLISLKEIRQNSNPSTPTCQDALKEVFQLYQSYCYFPGRIDYSENNMRSLQNWIWPLCNLNDCAKISYNWQRPLIEVCPNENEIYVDNGTLTGLTRSFFQNYRLEKQGGSSQICKMELTQDGVYCAARFFDNLQKMWIKGISVSKVFGYCNESCAWAMSRAICDSADNEIVRGGSSSEEEMCFNFIEYYPGEAFPKKNKKKKN
ncbi:hypothetical protein HDU92_002798 [Lobulomyces angularis]|nr:hypothetical protein HDU92_002798 [Lobulomyces angularis]